ncbi:MAG: hypothetical protein HYV07_00470 [Deltaproteobacteria bacterium]|nr:hypothetical protein [Deltaproteobacteria bacterium]
MYAVRISDSDPGDTESLVLETGPSGASLSGTELELTPEASDVGVHLVSLRAEAG